MSLHDQTASVLALARVIRDGIDPATTHTSVQNESLKLLIATLIECAQPDVHRKLDSEAAKTVAGMIAPPILDDRKEGGNGRWI